MTDRPAHSEVNRDDSRHAMVPRQWRFQNEGLWIFALMAAPFVVGMLIYAAMLVLRLFGIL